MEVDLLERFRAHLWLEDDLSDNTVRAYDSDLRQYLRYLGARVIPLCEATRQDIVGFLVEERREGASPATRQRRLSAVRHLYRYALREGLVGANPTEFIPRIRKTRGLPVVLSVPEVARLLEGFPTDSPLALRDRTILEALYGAGLRVSELLDLDLPDLDLAERCIRCRGNGGRTRLAPVGDHLALWFARYLQEARGSLATPRSGEALFLNSRGGRLSRKGCWRMVFRRARQAGITKHVSPHTLRHTFATHMRAGGADLRVIQELLGHANLASTQLYVQIEPARLPRLHRLYHPRARRNISRTPFSLDRFPRPLLGCYQQSQVGFLIADLSFSDLLRPIREIIGKLGPV